VLAARRRTTLAAGATVVALATLLTLLVSGGATGANSERCARFSAQSQVRERLVTGAGRRIVVIGDSYSVGLGLRDPEASWPSRLPGRTHVFGFSGSGFSAHASSCGHVAYADRASRAAHSGRGLVVVEGGLNDVDRPVAEVRAGFRSLIRLLHGREVLVVGPPSAPVRTAGAARVDAILRQESARAGVRYLSVLSTSFSYLDDGLHLTPAGHRSFGTLVAGAITG
jgi:acyl-CoA thioesterase I